MLPTAFGFQAFGSRRVEADFSGGLVFTDGGALRLGEMDRRPGLCDKLAACFRDERNQDFVEHLLVTLTRQRLLGLALGYEDLNDHDDLRRDPLLATACGHTDPLGVHVGYMDGHIEWKPGKDVKIRYRGGADVLW